MPERDNDRIESFFKKVAGRPDISFNEEDWKKLELRLDAKEARQSVARKNRNRIAGATIVAVMLMSGVYWFGNNENQKVSLVDSAMNSVTTLNRSEEKTESVATIEETPVASPLNKNELNVRKEENYPVEKTSAGQKVIRNQSDAKVSNVVATGTHVNALRGRSDKSEHGLVTTVDVIADISQNEEDAIANISQNDGLVLLGIDQALPHETGTTQEDNRINDTSKSLPALAEENKQKASKEDSVEREKKDVKVIDAYGSGLTEHPASPRLSLLLSVAPDFSTVAFDYYADPGAALGLMVHYHIKNSWSVSTGVVKSRKKYTGDGEDYQPPKGYWKYYTNGIVPETIDGVCNVLEIPIMVQYTIAQKGKNRFLAGAGTSSYIMLNETYKYNFDQPNPGAKDGWTSKKQSSVFFNMINVTVGFEHQIFPGLRLGVEPYIKLPVGGIGWSDLKLYSAGASVTLRYIVLKKKNLSLPVLESGTEK